MRDRRAGDDEHGNHPARAGLPRSAAAAHARGGNAAGDRRDSHVLGGAGRRNGGLGLEPDLLTIGKAIAGGVPAGALGVSDDLADRILGDPQADLEDTGGIGGTLAGNALSLAAMRATLGEVLTLDAFAQAIAVADRLRDGIEQVIAAHDVPWHVRQLGARVEYGFTAVPPRNGSESRRAQAPELERYLHLHALNRGVLITPFHNMLLACPATSSADADRHTEVFGEAVAQLLRIRE